MTILKIVAYKYLDEITQATLLIIGGVHKNPGPITREKDQLQIITQNVRGMIEVKKKKLIIILLVNFCKRKIKTIQRYHCGSQVKGPHLTLGDPPFYS